MRPETREKQFEGFYPIAPIVLLTAWDWAKSFLPALHEIELQSSNRYVERAGLLRRQNRSSTPLVVAKQPERKTGPLWPNLLRLGGLVLTLSADNSFLRPPLDPRPLCHMGAVISLL